MAPAAESARGRSLAGCSRPLCEAYDAALYDLDGVLYVGPAGVPHAATAVAAARAHGMRAAFVTNNASRRPGPVAEHLVQLGIPADPEDVVTSGQAAVRLLVEELPPGSAVLVLGTAGLAEEVRLGGLRPVSTVDEAGSGGPAAVLQGLDVTICWADLAEACIAIRAGAVWVAGNADVTYPSARGPVPGNGALVAALVAATGQRPTVAGKPEPTLHQESLRRVGARRALVVGDRLDTDVLGAVRGGTDSLLVLTGVTDREELLAAPSGMRPTYVAQDLRGLLVAHPAPTVQQGGATCGQGKAWYEQGLLRTDGDEQDALRAACALAWSRADAAAGGRGPAEAGSVRRRPPDDQVGR